MPININGGSRSAGGWWAKHLGNRDKNERVEVIEFAGLNAQTMPEAFREMYAVSRGTKCDNYFYQANINPRADEHLTPEQWREAVDTLERNLGLTGQPRFVVEHEKEGRTHRHAVWSRIDPVRMVAISDSLTAAIHERTSRELEIRFDLERGQSILVADRDFDRPERRPKKHETVRALDSGIRPEAVKAEVSALWRTADNAHSFKVSLEASGYILARGDRRDFVIVDRAGDDHSLARRAGVKAVELRERMKEIDRASLPSVAEARALQRAHAAERAPNFDRDAASAIAKEAARSTQKATQQPQTAQEAERDQPSARGRYAALRPAERAGKGRAERYASRAAPATMRPVAENDGMRSPAASGGRLLGSIAKIFESLIMYLADLIAPPPPLTKDQAERAEQVATERHEQQVAARQAEQERHEMLLQRQPSRDISTRQIEPILDPEQARVAPKRSRDKERERELER